MVNPNGHVSLREFIERIIQENNRHRDDLRTDDRRWMDEIVKHLRERFDTSVAEVDKARELQAKEYERRLETLNHEAVRILKAIEITVSRDTWDGFLKEYQDYKASTEKALTLAAGRSQMVAFIITGVGAFSGLIVYLLTR